ncbi:SDR family oxidoreductase [uncultured Bacteroides sp.]|nr:SDR family oxidoreductase [uncultured Bacteroides sp.]
MYNPFSIEDKSILITGASSGIGRQTAIECSKLGARVIITGRNEERLKETLSLMVGDGHNYVLCDLSQSKGINDFVDSLPILDGYVSNAGMSILAPVHFIKEQDLNKMFQVNTLSPILLLKQLLKKKKVAKGCSVVFTSSIAPLGASVVGNAVYTATKGAISGFVQNAALDLGSKNIRVNAICPGMTETPMIKNNMAEQEMYDEDKKNYALGRYAEPKEIAWGIIYLLSNASSFVTGTNLIIDGGFTIR